MEILSLTEENIIKDLKNLLILKKEPNYTAINDIRIFFLQEKETIEIKYRILRDIENLFGNEDKENYHKSVRVIIF